MKQCSASIFNKMKIKPGDMTTHLLECQNIKAYIYILAMPSVGRYMEELAFLNIAVGRKNPGTLRNICHFLKKLKIYLLYDSVIPLNLPKRSNSTQPYKDL